MFRARRFVLVSILCTIGWSTAHAGPVPTFGPPAAKLERQLFGMAQPKPTYKTYRQWAEGALFWFGVGGSATTGFFTVCSWQEQCDDGLTRAQKALRIRDPKNAHHQEAQDPLR